jgi:hypothetical protein
MAAKPRRNVLRKSPDAAVHPAEPRTPVVPAKPRTQPTGDGGGRSGTRRTPRS